MDDKTRDKLDEMFADMYKTVKEEKLHEERMHDDFFYYATHNVSEDNPNTHYEKIRDMWERRNKQRPNSSSRQTYQQYHDEHYKPKFKCWKCGATKGNMAEYGQCGWTCYGCLVLLIFVPWMNTKQHAKSEAWILD